MFLLISVATECKLEFLIPGWGHNTSVATCHEDGGIVLASGTGLYTWFWRRTMPQVTQGALITSTYMETVPKGWITKIAGTEVIQDLQSKE